MKTLASFAHPQVIPNIYCMTFFLEIQKKTFKKKSLFVHTKKDKGVQCRSKKEDEKKKSFKGE